jgi:hypothetical protein
LTIETSFQALKIVEQMRSLHQALAIEGLRRMPTGIIRHYLTHELPGFKPRFARELRKQILSIIDPCVAQAIGKIDVCRADVLPLILDPRFPELGNRKKNPPLREDTIPILIDLDIALGDAIEIRSKAEPGSTFVCTAWGAGEGRIVRVVESSGLHILVRPCPADLLLRLDLCPKSKGDKQ